LQYLSVKEILLKWDIMKNETLWFKLLDSVVKPVKDLKDTIIGSKKKKFRSTISKNIDIYITDSKEGHVKLFLISCAREILDNMIGYVALTSILEKIVKDYGEDKFGDFKSIFITMLDVTSYERSILKSANQLFDDDTFKQVKILLEERKKYLPFKQIIKTQMNKDQQLEHKKRVENCNIKQDTSKLSLLKKLTTDNTDKQKKDIVTSER